MIMIMSMGWDYVSELRPPTDLLLIPQMIQVMSMENHGGKMSTGESPSFVHRASLPILPAVI